MRHLHFSIIYTCAIFTNIEDANEVFVAKTPASPSCHKLYPQDAESVKNEGFHTPFLGEVIRYKTLMYFSSPPPFLDSSRYIPGIKRLTLSQS